MTTVVNKYKEPFDVDITRNGKWGNPFVIGRDGDRPTVIAKHKAWLPKQKHLMAVIKKELKDQALGCVCAPLPCHGDNLKEEADRE